MLHTSILERLGRRKLPFDYVYLRRVATCVQLFNWVFDRVFDWVLSQLRTSHHAYPLNLQGARKLARKFT